MKLLWEVGFEDNFSFFIIFDIKKVYNMYRHQPLYKDIKLTNWSITPINQHLTKITKLSPFLSS